MSKANESKSQFLARPKIASLSKAEQERRWEQHVKTGKAKPARPVLRAPAPARSSVPSSSAPRGRSLLLEPASSQRTLPPNGSNETRSYLTSLLSPEMAHGSKVPDQYTQPTASFQTVTTSTLPFAEDGSCCLLVTPHPESHLFQVADVAGHSAMIGPWVSDGLYLKPSPEWAEIADPAASAWLPANIGVTGLPNDTIVVAACPPAQDTFFPPGRSTLCAKPNAVSNGAVANANNAVACETAAELAITLEIVTSPFGTTPTVVESIVTFLTDIGTYEQQTTTDTIPVAASADENYMIQRVGLFNTPPSISHVGIVGWSLRVTAGEPLVVNKMWMEFQYGSTETGSGTMYSTPVPDFDTEFDDVQQYRLVSMSVLVSQTGPALEAGGTIAGALVQTSEHPQIAGVTTFDRLSERPFSFNGPITTGIYGIWLPVEVADVQFRDPREPWRWDRPYLAISGVRTSNDASLRVTVHANWEIVSRGQRWDLKYSPFHPNAMALAFQTLVGYPAIMENPTHVAAIKDFLKKARGAVNATTDVAKIATPLIRRISPSAANAVSEISSAIDTVMSFF